MRGGAGDPRTWMPDFFKICIIIIIIILYKEPMTEQNWLYWTKQQNKAENKIKGGLYWTQECNDLCRNNNKRVDNF